MINPTEEQFSEWMQRYYPPPEPQPSRQRRLAELAQQEAMLADLAQTQDPENAAIMQRMAPQPQELQQRNQLSALAQPQPMNTIKSSSGRTIDLGYAAPGGSGVSPEGFKAKPDPWANGPRELSRKQLQDGTFEVIREYPAVDGFGRQSSKLVREIETPAYLNPAETKRLQFEKLSGEARKANITPEQEAKREALIEAEKAKTPGTEAYKRLQGEKQAEQKSAQKLKVFEAKARLVKEKVDEALLDAGRLSTGIIGQMTRGVGETPAFNLQQTVATVKANIGFDELQKMRDNSPTGGALGQVAIQELERLEATLGSLDTAQSEEKLRNNLKAVKTHYNNWLAIMREADKSGNAPSMPEAPQPAASMNTVTLPDGRTLRFPSGAAAEAFRRKAGL